MPEMTFNLDDAEQTEKFRKFVKRAVNEVLDERDALDHETHKAHHEAVAKYIEKQVRRDELFEKASNSFVGAAVVSLVGAITWCLSGLGKMVIAYFDRIN